MVISKDLILLEVLQEGRELTWGFTGLPNHGVTLAG